MSRATSPISDLSLSGVPGQSPRPPVGGQSHEWLRRVFLGAAFCLVLVSAYRVYAAWASLSIGAPPSSDSKLGDDGSRWERITPREVPLRIDPIRPVGCKSASIGDIPKLRQRLVFSNLDKMPIAYYLHVLRAFGLGPIDHPRLKSGADVVRILTDSELSKAYFDEPLGFTTRSGVRYKSMSEGDRVGEGHRDYCLAAFAELGLPLTTPIHVTGRAMTLADLLHDSVDNFYLKEKEIEWTATALFLCLPPQSEWTNRYGEQFTFDDLAREILRRRFGDSSCGGSHLLYSLAVLVRVDRVCPVMSEPVRQAVVSRLRECVAALVRSQGAEGYWTRAWYQRIDAAPKVRQLTPPDTLSDRLLITGHVLEFMLVLPAEMQPQGDVFNRGGAWLHQRLQRMSAADVKADYCPYTHCLKVLEILSAANRNFKDPV